MPISLWHIILAVRHSPQMPTWMCARMLITPPPQCDKGMRPLPHLSTLFCEVGLLPRLSVSGLSKAANRRLLGNRSFHLVAVPLNKNPAPAMPAGKRVTVGQRRAKRRAYRYEQSIRSSL